MHGNQFGRDRLGAALPLAAAARSAQLQSWPLRTSRRTGIHDVAPAPDGGVWFSAQASGHLGYFDPARGTTELIGLGGNSSPHGVIQGPDKAAWLTDGGAQAIVRVGWPDRLRFGFPRPGTRIRQILGRRGEVWLPESGTEHISVIRAA